MDLPRVCVIGAGSSGIATLKALHERGLPVDCLLGKLAAGARRPRARGFAPPIPARAQPPSASAAPR